MHADNEVDEKDMLYYLLYDFCNDDYERSEMLKWIYSKDIRYVYTTVYQLSDD